jgi:putative DNA-invertase from lambdoid prophage Rac
MSEQTKAGAWFRVSTGHQSDANQVPDVEAFAAHHGYEIAERYQVSDSAWKNGGGEEYKAALQQALDDAWAGKFSVLVVWSLDRIVRLGAEDALRIFRRFRERGCVIISVKESWLNGSGEVQDVLISFAGWMAQRESERRSERIRAGLARKRAEDPEFRAGRRKGSADKSQRRRSGYVKAWEDGGARRLAAGQKDEAGLGPAGMLAERQRDPGSGVKSGLTPDP